MSSVYQKIETIQAVLVDEDSILYTITRATFDSVRFLVVAEPSDYSKVENVQAYIFTLGEIKTFFSEQVAILCNSLK